MRRNTGSCIHKWRRTIRGRTILPVSFRTARSTEPESSNFLIILDSRFRGNDEIGRRGIGEPAIWHEFARCFAAVTLDGLKSDSLLESKAYLSRA